MAFSTKVQFRAVHHRRRRRQHGRSAVGGQLKGVIDTAASIADNDAIAYGNLQDVNAYESRGQWFDIAKTLGEEIPGVSALLDWNSKMPVDRAAGDLRRPARRGCRPHVYRAAEFGGDAVCRRPALARPQFGDPAFFAEPRLVDPATGQLITTERTISTTSDRR